MKKILLHYKGTSFDGQIDLGELANALKGFEELVKILDPDCKLNVIALENGSFKIPLSSKNIAEGVVIGVIILGIQFFIFTKGESYKIDMSNSTFNGDINIVNIDGENQTFNKSILPYVKNEKFVKNVGKISSPLIY